MKDTKNLLLVWGAALLLLVVGTAHAAQSYVTWNPDPLAVHGVVPGDEANYSVELKNIGDKPIPTAPQSIIEVQGDIAPYLTIEQPQFPKNIAPNQTVTFSVAVSIPNDTQPGTINGQLILTRINRNKVKDVWKEALPVNLVIESPEAISLRLKGINPSSALPGTRITLLFTGGSPRQPLFASLSGESVAADWMTSGADETPNTAEITVPQNAQSGPLSLTQENNQSNSVWFQIGSGGVLTPQPEEIDFDEYGNPVATSLLLVSLKDGFFNLGEGLRLAALVGGEISAELPLVSGYQIHLPTMDLGSLMSAKAIYSGPHVQESLPPRVSLPAFFNRSGVALPQV